MAQTKAEKQIREYHAEVHVGERVLSKVEAVEHLATYKPVKVRKERERYSAGNPRRPKTPKMHTHRGGTWGELANVRVMVEGEQRSINTTIKTTGGSEFEPDTPVTVTCKTLATAEMWSARPVYGKIERGARPYDPAGFSESRGLKPKGEVESAFGLERIEVELFGKYPCGLVKHDADGTAALAAVEREHASQAAAKKSLSGWHQINDHAYTHQDGYKVYRVSRLDAWGNSKEPVTHHKTMWDALNKRDGWEVDAEGVAVAVDTPAATETTTDTPAATETTTETPAATETTTTPVQRRPRQLRRTETPAATETTTETPAATETTTETPAATETTTETPAATETTTETPAATETTTETPEPIATPVAVEPEPEPVSAKTVIVCGGRTFTDFYQVQKVLDARRDYIDKVVTGGGRGADGLAMQWAHENGIGVQVFEADWERHKRAAGPVRNKRMIAESGAARVIAFAGGVGTFGICELAERAGLVVERIPARADGQPEPQIKTQPAPPARPKIDSAERVESITEVEEKARASGKHIGRALAENVMAEIEAAAKSAAG